ncbi:MAG: hypothetical protein LBQ51_08560 [Desulfovibrio sp.]|jgi:hypothetical protein|nr:hypothetical protein [Desulfovibrio sp.]
MRVYLCLILSAFAALCAELSGAGASPADLYTAPGPVRGVGTLRPGPPMPAARPGAYGNHSDYLRGYVGNNPEPGDFWHRENDFKARDYLFKYGPQPEFASPPGTVDTGTEK